VSGDAIANVSCVDGLAILANQTLVPQAVIQQKSGERVNAVLANSGVSWAGATSIDTGVSELAAGTASDNILSYIRTVEESEQGYFYVSRSGVLTFRNRHTTLNSPIAGDLFSDDGTGIPYDEVSRFSGARSLFNRVTARLEDGVEVSSDNAASQAEFSIRTLDLGTVLLRQPSVASDLTQYLLFQYSEPTTRIESLTVNLNGQDFAVREKLLAFDLGDICDARFSPPGAASFTDELFVQGIRHTATVVGPWRTTFSFARRDTRQFFVLDDAEFGRLDENVVAF